MKLHLDMLLEDKQVKKVIFKMMCCENIINELSDMDYMIIVSCGEFDKEEENLNNKVKTYLVLAMFWYYLNSSGKYKEYFKFMFEAMNYKFTFLKLGAQLKNVTTDEFFQHYRKRKLPKDFLDEYFEKNFIGSAS